MISYLIDDLFNIQVSGIKGTEYIYINIYISLVVFVAIFYKNSTDYSRCIVEEE